MPRAATPRTGLTVAGQHGRRDRLVRELECQAAARLRQPARDERHS
jgi:hypothetical protein